MQIATLSPAGGQRGQGPRRVPLDIRVVAAMQRPTRSFSRICRMQGEISVGARPFAGLCRLADPYRRGVPGRCTRPDSSAAPCRFAAARRGEPDLHKRVRTAWGCGLYGLSAKGDLLIFVSAKPPPTPRRPAPMQAGISADGSLPPTLQQQRKARGHHDKKRGRFRCVRGHQSIAVNWIVILLPESQVG